jgi:hypothetical protein
MSRVAFPGSAQDWDQALERFIEQDSEDALAPPESEFLATLEALLGGRASAEAQPTEEVTVKAFVCEGNLVLRRPAPLRIEDNALCVGRQRIRIQLEQAA